MKRRTFLKSLSSLPVIAYMPVSLRAQESAEQKVLILVQFGGGNDSLNMCVPYANSAYYDARPSLSVDTDSVLPLTSELGLNPVMEPVMEAWNSADMAIVEGLGYPAPNRSHFRSIDIWQSASHADEFLTTGWLTEVLPDAETPLQGVVISGSPGALRGEPNQFGLTSSDSNNSQVYAPSGTAATSEITHVMNQRASYNQAITEINSAFSEPFSLTATFENDSFSQACALTAELLGSGIRPHIIHLSLGSFDTHSNQRGAHDTLLAQLSAGLGALRAELQAQGIWQQVTIASYSEFGRRVAENASGGTDHGTAASHFVMGGSVKGGIYGTSPSLTELENGDMIFTEDFRAYYRTLSDWMSWEPSGQLEDFLNIGFL